MSFSRWGAESDVYVFTFGYDEFVTCFGCLFSPEPEDDPYFFQTRNLDDMLDHLREHERAGHEVPDELESKLRDRWPFPNDGVE